MLKKTFLKNYCIFFNLKLHYVVFGEELKIQNLDICSQRKMSSQTEVKQHKIVSLCLFSHKNKGGLFI